MLGPIHDSYHYERSMPSHSEVTEVITFFTSAISENYQKGLQLLSAQLPEKVGATIEAADSGANIRINSST